MLLSLQLRLALLLVLVVSFLDTAGKQLNSRLAYSLTFPFQSTDTGHSLQW